jgi:uncharacterized protein (DUF2461 family)
MFTGWPSDATAFLTEIEADNTREFWEANAHRHARSVQAPMRALAAELEPEFGPIRVLRAHRNRRFRPEAPPYRTDAGGVATSPGGSALTVVLSATALTATAGHWRFDPGQLRRYRVAVLEAPGEELPALLAGHQVDHRRSLRGRPRGFKGEHPRMDLLKLIGLQVVTSRPTGPWLCTRDPLEWVRAAWLAAAPVVGWLDAHVGPPDRVPPRPRPAPPD